MGDTFWDLLRDIPKTPLSEWTTRPEDTETFGELGRRLLPVVPETKEPERKLPAPPTLRRESISDVGEGLKPGQMYAMAEPARSVRAMIPGGEVELPAEMTEAQIEAAVRKFLGLPASPPPPPAEQMPQGVIANIPSAIRETFGLGERPSAVPLTGTPAVKTPLGVVLKPEGVLEHLTSAAVTAPALMGAGGLTAPARALPYLGRLVPTAARVGTAGAIGAAREPAQPIRGAVKGAAAQLVGGEVAAPVAVRVAQRFGPRAFERLSDELADEIMRRAKTLIPAWRTLPDGQEGVRALMQERGMDILSKGWNQMEARRVGFRIGRVTPEGEAKARETFREGINLIHSLRTLKALNPATGRVDPEALVEGLAKASGVKNPLTVWDRFLTERKAPGARQLVKALEGAARSEGGAAPTVGELHLPFFGVYGHHMRMGEGLPFLKYSAHIPTTPIEEAARRMAPAVGGALSLQTAPSFLDLAEQARR